MQSSEYTGLVLASNNSLLFEFQHVFHLNELESWDGEKDEFSNSQN